LTHSLKGQIYNAVGNEGFNIIAVNLYEPKDLIPLAGKYLTSISVFLWGDVPGTIPSEFKLAVYKNGTRVESSDITSWKGYAWNTFNLSNPIKIPEGVETTIYAGIEDAYGDPYNRPIGIDADSIGTNPKGNLYSEDGGRTWQHASAANIWGNWGIIANFRDEPTAQTTDDDLFDVLYQVYRNGTPVDTMHYGQKFVDNNPGTNPCYTVKVFRSTGGMSPMSAQGCEQVLSKNEIVEYNEFAVVPNPAKDIVNITIDCQLVKVYDMNGQMLMQTSDKQVNIGNLANGTYIFEVTMTDGSKAYSKVIKK